MSPEHEFGNFLRLARERRGLSLQQISSSTKIPFRHLDALEHGDLRAVPGGMYRRGEVRAYADVVGLDRNEALAHLERALHFAHLDELVEVTPPPPPRQRQRAHALLVIATLVVLGLMMWSRVARAPDSNAGPQDVDLPVAAPPVARPVEEKKSAATTGDVRTQAPMRIAEPAVSNVDSRGVAPSPIVSGTLIVISDPPGARVTVNGVGWGTTPLTIGGLPVGDHRVRVTHAQHVGVERTVRLSGNNPSVELRIILEPSATR